MTTEFNTLFETVTSIAEKVDPIKLNQTLTATAQALTGLGRGSAQSLEHANVILDDLNPQMPRLREDTARVADLADVYAAASPDLFDGLDSAVTTARTFNAQSGDVDAALMAALGFANTATETTRAGGAVPGAQRRGPGADDQAARRLPRHDLLHHPQLSRRRTTRARRRSAGNGYSLAQYGTLLGFGAGNPFVYPDNLPRINAHGGPEGRPGCWQKVTTTLWPMPYLVMDTGFNLAPYNHVELGQPIADRLRVGPPDRRVTINP